MQITIVSVPHFFDSFRYPVFRNIYAAQYSD